MKYTLLFFTLAFSSIFNLSQAESSHAGVIVFVTGKASATDAKNVVRPLNRRTKIYVGDTLTTENNSAIHIRFIDGAIISLREDTALKVENYSYQIPGKKESSALSLLKGGFRTISGGIGKENYKVTTNMATIGIRGTTYEVAYDEHLYVGVWDGAVKVSNEGGEISLGLGAAYNFAQITHVDSAPAGLSNSPNVFKQQYKNNQKNSVQKDKEKRPAPLPNRQMIAQDSPQAPLSPPTDTLANTQPTQQRSVANINLNRLGLVTYSGESRPKFYGGKAGYDAGGNPVITDNGLGPHEAGFDSTAASYSFWKGNATTLSKGSKDYGNGYVVDWGVWDASTGKAVRQTDPEGLVFETDVQRNLFWLTMVQTPAATLSSLTGSATYTTSASIGNALGGGSGGAINNSNFAFNANTNFDTGVVSGSMTISNSDSWYVAFNGDPSNGANGKGLTNGVLDVTVDSSASTVQGTLGVKADLGIVITGANAEAMAGAFDLEAYNKSTNIALPTIHAEGVFVAEK